MGEQQLNTSAKCDVPDTVMVESSWTSDETLSDRVRMTGPETEREEDIIPTPRKEMKSPISAPPSNVRVHLIYASEST